MRQILATRRDDLGVDFRKRASEKIAKISAGEFAKTGLVTPGKGVASGFYPFNSEPDCLLVLSALNKAGFETALPVIVAPGQPLVFRQWRPGAPTIPGIWKIPVPREDAAILIPDILLVPLLGYDRAGTRIGYGGGYYDRTIAKLRANGKVSAVGLAFSAQQVDEVPREAHDMALDWMLTEAGLFRAGEQVS